MSNDTSALGTHHDAVGAELACSHIEHARARQQLQPGGVQRKGPRLHLRGPPQPQERALPRRMDPFQENPQPATLAYCAPPERGPAATSDNNSMANQAAAASVTVGAVLLLWCSLTVHGELCINPISTCNRRVGKAYAPICEGSVQRALGPKLACRVPGRHVMEDATTLTSSLRGSVKARGHAQPAGW